MNTFHVYITLLTSAYLDKIMGNLIRLGYDVGPLASGMLIANPYDPVSSCVALHVRSAKHITPTELLGQFKKSLDDIHAKYYNIIITSPSNATWVGSNIVASDLQRKPKALKHNHLKLVKTTEDKPEDSEE